MNLVFNINNFKYSKKQIKIILKIKFIVKVIRLLLKNIILKNISLNKRI